MPDTPIDPDVSLSHAAHPFLHSTSTESGEHIRPLHRYLAMRLVIEGGFLPADIAPTPPLRADLRAGSYYLSFDATAEDKTERVVLGALKSKRIDVVVAKEGIGPIVGISVKGTTRAFRNLVNRTEEAIGDCTNIHIMYPGLVYGFVHFLKAADAADATLKPNDVLLDSRGEVMPAARAYARILEGLTGRRLVRNDVARYEAASLVLLNASAASSTDPLLRTFPGGDSELTLESFFTTLYRTYDLRFAYTYTDATSLRHLTRVEWHPDSPALSRMTQAAGSVAALEYAPRIAVD